MLTIITDVAGMPQSMMSRAPEVMNDVYGQQITLA